MTVKPAPTGTLVQIDRYPVKGLRPDRMAAAELVPGRGLALDRRFALAKGSTKFDGDEPHWLPKSQFLVLAKNAKLAQLTTSFRDTTLCVFRKGRQVACGDLSTPMGRTIIEDFFAAFMGEEAQGKPKVVEMTGDRTFWDTPDGALTLINLASIRDLERITRTPVEPERFRGNLLVEGLDPWVEFDFIDAEVVIGSLRFKVAGRVDRCAATTVNPETAERDIQVPKALMQGFGHADLGVYLHVLDAGTITEGDSVTFSAAG
ncbi:MAG: MOSC domain-containing protein [Rhodospirillales bacterium]